MNLNVLKQRAKAFDFLFDSLIITDLQGIITNWNKGSEDLYGYSKEEAIGQPVSILHVPEDSASITTEVISAVIKFGKWTGEIRMRHKDGHIGWVESMCVPMYDENNQVVGALGVNRDITCRINESKHLEHIAHYDCLTKIPNRYLLFDRMEHLIAQSQRNGNTFALLFIDLDNFKTINDTKGHLFGDHFLIETAVRLKQAIRSSDTVARIGGDEFVLLLENISDKHYVAAMVESIKSALSCPFIIDNETVAVSCCVGVALYPDQGTTVDALIAVADKEMYKRK